MSYVNPIQVPDDWHPRAPVKFKCTRCGHSFMWPACECDECGAYPICSLCKGLHQQDGEHD